MSTPSELMLANLLDVFGERDPERRSSVAGRIYAPDVVFLDPDEVVTGRDALTAKAQAILDGAPGFVFVPSGDVHVNNDLAYLSWGFGPEGQDPVVRGMDICLIENDRIAKVYTFLES